MVPYHAGLRAEWDAFAATATAGTFLFQRSYLEYHADRFEDLSGMALLESSARRRMAKRVTIGSIYRPRHGPRAIPRRTPARHSTVMMTVRVARVVGMVATTT